MPRTVKRANPPPPRVPLLRGGRDPAEEARAVLLFALLSAAGPFFVLGLRPLFALAPLARWEVVVLVGVAPVLALMSLTLFVRSRGARARREGRVGAMLAATTLLLAAASAVVLLART